MSTIITIKNHAAHPVLMRGVVSAGKSDVTISRALPGSSKAETLVFPKTALYCYMEGSPGFIIASVDQPIITLAGEMDGNNISTEAGLVVMPRASELLVLREEIADSDPRIARIARSNNVKVRLPKAADEKPAKSKGKKKRAEVKEAKPSKKKRRE